MSSCVCKISFKSVHVCGGCCKMFRGLTFLGTQCSNVVNLHPLTPHIIRQVIPTKWRTYRDHRFGDVISPCVYTWCSDVISMPAGYRRHLMGKTVNNVCHCDLAEIRLVGKLMITRTFLLTNGLNFISNNTTNLRPFTPHIMPCYTHKMANVS